MKILGLVGAAVISAFLVTGSASAAPMSISGTAAGNIQSDNLIEQIQAGNRRGVRPGGGGARAFGGGGGRGFGGGGGGRVRAFGGGGGGRPFVRRGGGIGPGGAAAIGLGVLGAAVAIGAAQSCWRRQPVVNPWNEIVGYRRVYVC